MEQLYEGKAKKVFKTENPHEFLMEFKDDATAFNAKKKAQFKDKGRLNKKLTVHFFNLLAEAGVPTHLIKDIDETRVLVKAVKIVPIELVVRNICAGSLAKRLGKEEGGTLPFPVIEFYYKDDALDDPMINADHALAFEMATKEELDTMCAMARKINQVLTDFFKECGIKLVDFKLEFGRLTSDERTIVLADEISPDTCRLWDAKTNQKLDKDNFRRDLGDLIACYKEVLARVENAVKR